MNYIYIVFIIFFFLKGWYYGIYELNEQKNKNAATAIFLINIVSFIFASLSLYFFIS